MENIKVRAWDISKKKYHYPKLWDNTMPSNWEQHYILELFIGVYDIYRKEIYCNDKVQGRCFVQKSLNPDIEHQIIFFEGVITYAEGCYFVKNSYGQCVFSFNYQDYEIEVIGNIHES